MRLTKFTIHILALLSLICTSSFPEIAVAVPEKAEEDTDDYIDYSRDLITENVEYLGNRIDSLFGDERADDESNRSTLRLKQQYFVLDGKTGSFDVEATLNLKLPNLQKKEEEIRRTVFQNDQEEDGKKAPQRKEESEWKFNQESGVRVNLPLNYFVRGRLRRNFPIGPFINYFHEQVSWDSQFQWEEKTSLTSDHQIRPHLLFRILNEKDWAMTKREFGTTHGVSLLSDLDSRTGISFDARFFTKVVGHIWYEQRYSLGSTYRKALPNKWMFVEVTPVVYFDREDHFVGKAGIFISLELAFGSI